MNVLIINGHPRKDSFSEAIVSSYVRGAKKASVNTATLTLYEQTFDLNVTAASPKAQYMEPCIIHARELIKWAHHVVFVYPTWWGTMPALLKGFIDRVFTEGFAFHDIEGGTGYAPLLRGKTAQIITTMDTPHLVYQLLYRAPGHNAMRRATLEFCGFQMARTISFSPIRNSTERQRLKWLAVSEKAGESLKSGSLSPFKKLSVKIFIWLKALRLQFYPMTFIAYATGALAAEKFGFSFSFSNFWLGYLWLFFLEAATVLLNEYFDYSSDNKNRYFGPFTGGSRVLVDQLLTFPEVRKGIFVFLFLTATTLAAIIFRIDHSVEQVLPFSLLVVVLALGYTVPPLNLSYRGLGELTVGLTHSFAVIVCGYLFMGGHVSDYLPWILGTPLFIAVLPSIILAGIPDYDADKEAGKKTLAVQFGKKNAAGMALAFTWLALIVLMAFSVFRVLPEAFKGLPFFALPHAIFLTFFLTRYIKYPRASNRIDTMLIISLIYLVWFGLIPLINLA